MIDDQNPLPDGLVHAPPELNAAIEESLEIGLTVMKESGVRLSLEMMDIVRRLVTTKTVVSLWRSALTFLDEVHIIAEVARSALDEYCTAHPLPKPQAERMFKVVVVIIGPILIEVFAHLPRASPRKKVHN